MAYLTKVPGAVLTVDGVSLRQVVELPETSVLNGLSDSQEISSYQVHDDDNGPETLGQGDYMAPVVGDTAIPGTYIGAGIIENAGLQLGSMIDSGLGGIAALGINISVNPISGDYFADENGEVYFISEEPLSADRLMASITVNLPLNNNAVTLEVPVSGLSDALGGLDPTGLLSGILGGVTNVTQYVLDTAVLTTSTDPNETKTLESGEFTVEPVCYLEGTKILTDKGEVSIEDLREGDMVVCRFGGLRPVKWIGKQRTVAKSGITSSPILIKAGALSKCVPATDLYVSQGHSMLVGDVLVLAKDLVNGITVQRVTEGDSWQYYQIDFGVHDLVLANRSWSESFADCQDFRKRFDNYAEYRLRFGHHTAPESPELCLERPKAGVAYYSAIASVAAAALDAATEQSHGQLEGRVESVSRPNLIRGWAVDTSRRGQPVQLEVVLDGNVVGETIACIPSEEYVDQGRMIFEFRFPTEVSNQDLLRTVVRRKADGKPVASLPSAVIGAMHGAIDLVRHDGRIEGWARDKSFPEQPIMLEVMIGEQVLGTVLACRPRRDLEKVGFGDVAFTFDANRVIQPCEVEALQIRRIRDGSVIRTSERTRHEFDRVSELRASAAA